MVRLLSVLIVTSSALLVCAADPTDADLRKKPITPAGGPLGDLLRLWYKEGTAAGNVGDWYDNRDGEHSPLDLSPYPQLRKVAYSAADVKAHRHWALQPRVLPHVVFGNSSTSAPPQYSGSNPRSYYCSPAGLNLLQAHYAKNNLYIYPEHRDHDPGHNGVGDGYGDLYPTNTPFLLISQGSSGSDQPFMHAIPFTLAAFRPDVKKKLVETGLLMPTVQMILRSTNRRVKKPEDYLTGKAHPTVFEGSDVDALAMVKKAHAITIDDIPPLVKLAVLEENLPVNGKDYFEPAGLTEKLTETTAVIARIWRGASGRRRMVVKAGDSIDINKKPLTFRWVVLRGDEKRIQIKPANKAGNAAEIIVDYQERRPIAPGSAMESNRVDIGVFASNGVHWSAPAFITFFSLDSESRTYDKAKPIEIAYGMGFTELRLSDPVKLLAELGKDGPAARVLQLSAGQREELGKAAQASAGIARERDQLRMQRKEAEDARNKSATAQREAETKREQLGKDKKDKEMIAKATQAATVAKDEAIRKQKEWQTLDQKVQKSEGALANALDTPLPGLKVGPLPFVQQALGEAARSPTFWHDRIEPIRRLEDRGKASPQVIAARAKLIRLGVIADEKGDTIKLTPVRAGKSLAEQLTIFEKAMIEEFNAVAMAELYLPGILQPVFHVHFVDARLTAPKRWRDVYLYEGDTLLGWTRLVDGKPGKADYTAEGWRVVTRDDKGRPTEARTVEYRQARAPAGTMWANPHPLEPHDGPERITFTYEDGKRKIKSREKVDPEGPAKK